MATLSKKIRSHSRRKFLHKEDGQGQLPTFSWGERGCVGHTTSSTVKAAQLMGWSYVAFSPRPCHGVDRVVQILCSFIVHKLAQDDAGCLA